MHLKPDTSKASLKDLRDSAATLMAPDPQKCTEIKTVEPTLSDIVGFEAVQSQCTKRELLSYEAASFQVYYSTRFDSIVFRGVCLAEPVFPFTMFQAKPFFLSSCRARSRLGRSSKRLVVDQLFSRCTRTGEKQKARCLPKSKQNKPQTQTQPKQTQQTKTPRKLSETLRFQKIQSS